MEHWCYALKDADLKTCHGFVSFGVQFEFYIYVALMFGQIYADRGQ